MSEEEYPKVSARELRTSASDVLGRVAYGKERIIVQRRGKDYVAIVPLEDLELVEVGEDVYWGEEARKVLADPSVKWTTLVDPAAATTETES